MTTSPKPGDMINITDGSDTNHVKAYLINKVESNTIYETSGLAASQRRIHITPPLVRNVSIGATSITTSSIDSSTDVLTTASAHGLTVGQQIKAVSGVTGGLLAGTIYWVKTVPSSTTFTLAPDATLATVVDLTNTTNTTFAPNPTVVVFTNPKIRCILQGDVQEYQLSTNGLYQFELALEEILP